MIMAALREAVKPWRRVLVAFSGGLDSTVLLHQLYLLQTTERPDLVIRALHIHHGISALANNWVEHCRVVCSQLSIPFSVTYVTLDTQAQGIEAAARAARYQAFANALAHDEALMTAQHLDDQCETFLLALKRGSGPAGLAAMPFAQDFQKSQLVRPFLTINRQTLADWAIMRGLSWIEDDSNQDDRYDRNFLRLHILPELTSRWPRFANMVARSAALCAEQEQLLDELLAESLQSALGPENQLQLEVLRQMSPPRRRALLRRWFAIHHAPMPSRAALQRVWDEVALSRPDAAPRLQFGHYDVRRYNDALWWVRRYQSQRQTLLDWPLMASRLILPDGLGYVVAGQGNMRVREPTAQETVTIRFNASGLIYPCHRAHGRSLKKLWQEFSVPPWLRDITPLLFYGDELIAAVGVFVTRNGEATEHSSQQIAWHRGDD